MLEWFSYTVAVILLISSVVSPWLVNKENNKHQLKIKKLDMYEEAKRKALADFIDSAQDYLLNPGYVEQAVKYYSSLDKLFIYFSGISMDTFIPFDDASKNVNDYSFATAELTKIAQVLSKQIQKE